jgi:hypothetical protein
MSISFQFPPEMGVPSMLHFAQHHAYPLRERWITRGVLELAEAERQGDTTHLFAHPAATDRFGLGPAMVQALRFWLRASGLMVERPGRGMRRVPALTPFGALLARHDPYLEDHGSVWWLHAHLVRNWRDTPAFTWFFQCFLGMHPFTKEECVTALHAWAVKEASRQQITIQTLRKDVECVLRMYLPQQFLSPEEELATSPFQRLGLLASLSARMNSGAERPARRSPVQYRFRVPQIGVAPALVVLAVLLDGQPAGQRFPLRYLLYGPGQVGQSLGLTQEVLFDALNSLRAFVPDWCPWIEQTGAQEWVVLPAVSVELVMQHYYATPPRS